MLQTYLIKGRFRRVFSVLLVLVLLRAKAFFSPPPVADFSSFPFQQWIFGPLLLLPHAAFWLNLLLIAGLAFGFNYVLRFYRYVPFRSYMVALIFILLFSHAPWLLTLHPLLLPVVFLIISFIFSLRMSNTKENYIQIYWAAFFTGLAAMSYPLTGFFIFYIILAIAVNSNLRWREFMLTLIGFFNPILLLLAGLYIFDHPVGDLWQQIQAHLHLPVIIAIPTLEWAFVALSAMLSVWVFFSVAGLAGKKALSFRKYTWLHIWFLVVSLFSSLWAGDFFIYYLALSSIPLSSFMAVYYSEENRSFRSEMVLFVLFLIAWIQNNFIG